MNLETWNNRIMNRKSPEFWLWFLAIAVVITVIATPIIFAIDGCWENSSYPSCNVSGVVSSGSLIVPDYDNCDQSNNCQDYCDIMFDTSNSTSGTIKIEVISGGTRDSDRDHSFLVTSGSYYTTNPYRVYLDKTTSPVYILCKDWDVNNYRDGKLIQEWTASYWGGYFEFMDFVNKPNNLGIDFNPSGTLNLLMTAGSTMDINADLNTSGNKSVAIQGVRSGNKLDVQNAVSGTITNTNAGTVALTGIPSSYTQTVRGAGATYPLYLGLNTTDLNINIDTIPTVYSEISGIDINGDFNIGNLTIPTELEVTLDGNIGTEMSGSWDLDIADTNFIRTYETLDNTNPFVKAIGYIFTFIGFIALLLVLLKLDMEWF